MRKMIIPTLTKVGDVRYRQMAVKPDGTPVPFYDIKDGLNHKEYLQQVEEGDLVITSRRDIRGLLHDSNSKRLSVSIVFNNQLTRIHPSHWLMNQLLSNELVNGWIMEGDEGHILCEIEETLIWRQVSATAHAAIPNISFWESEIHNSFNLGTEFEGYSELSDKVKRLILWIYHEYNYLTTPSKLIQNTTQAGLLELIKQNRGKTIAFVHLSNKGIMLVEYPDRPMSLHYLPLDTDLSVFGKLTVVPRKDS